MRAPHDPLRRLAMWKQPLLVAALAVLLLSASRPVSWGDGTTDEMAIVFVGVTVDGERIGWRPR